MGVGHYQGHAIGGNIVGGAFEGALSGIMIGGTLGLVMDAAQVWGGSTSTYGSGTGRTAWGMYVAAWNGKLGASVDVPFGGDNFRDGSLGKGGEGNGINNTIKLDWSNRDVCSISNGYIYKIGWQNHTNPFEGFGYRIWIKSIDGDYFYGHMSEYEISVYEKQMIMEGMHLGKYASPTNGHSSGPHVHLGKRNVFNQWVFPGFSSPLKGVYKISSYYRSIDSVHHKPHKGVDYVY